MIGVQKKFQRRESQCPRFSIKILKVRSCPKKSNIRHLSFGNIWYYLKLLPEHEYFYSSRRKSSLLEIRYWYQHYTGSDINTVTLGLVTLGCSH